MQTGKLREHIYKRRVPNGRPELSCASKVIHDVSLSTRSFGGCTDVYCTKVQEHFRFQRDGGVFDRQQQISALS